MTHPVTIALVEADAAVRQVYERNRQIVFINCASISDWWITGLVNK